MEEISKIRFLSGPLAEKVISIQNMDITIGQDKRNDICVPDPKVSQRHVRIYRQEGTWRIENLSRNTSVTVNQLSVSQSTLLQHNAIVRLSDDTSFVFFIQSSVPPAKISPTYQPSLPEIHKDIADIPTLITRVPVSSPTQGIPVTSLPPVVPAIPPGVAPTGTALLSLEPDVPSLTVSSNLHSNILSYPLKKPVINIGRDSDNDISLPEMVVSGQHLQIIRDNDNFFLVHPHPSREKTRNGIWYQGRPIHGDQPFRKQLIHGDIFRIGSSYGTLVTFVYNDGSGISLEDPPEMQPISLTKEKLTIGRVQDNTVVLNHLQVSAHHAVLEKLASGYCITDLNSTNHIYVNGQIVTNQILRTNDEIRIGPYRFTYTGAQLKQYDESAHIRIDASHLKKFGDRQRILLNDITLTIPPRKFVALVGGSGAGKSTLIDALSGLRPAQEGTVLYNGIDYYRNLAVFNTKLGYVPQENIVHRNLTVARALYYAARLRLPSDLTREQIQWRINEVLEDMEIADRRDLMVYKLSGGQLKRVSIALELLANPSIFFLDEPTSGLDPGLDRKMMMLLRRLADRGHTIILVTHATNNINVCDYVCFLAQGGYLAYFGPPNKAKEYFDKPDFAEIYSELEPTKEEPDIPEQAEALFRTSPDHQQYVVSLLSERPTQLLNTKARRGGRKRQQKRRGQSWSQFLLLSMRYLELLKNDTGNLLLLLLQAPVIAIVLVAAAHFQIGTDIFDPGKVAQCQTQAVDPNGSANKIEVTMPQALQHGDQPGLITINCNNVLRFLKDAQNAGDNQNQVQSQQNALTARSYKDAQTLIQKRGGINQALQDFIQPGSGAEAQKLLFLMAFASIFFGANNGMREFVKEEAIYQRERAVNLGILPYMFSKILVLGTLCLLQSAVFVVVIELGESLHQAQGVFLLPIVETYITIALTSLAGLMIGLSISAMVTNNDRAVTLLPLALIPQAIFAGSIIPQKALISQIMAMVWPIRWTSIALGSSVGLHSNSLGKDHLFGNDESYHGTLFSIYSQADAMQRLIFAWVCLGTTIIVLMIVTGIFLKRKDVKA